MTSAPNTATLPNTNTFGPMRQNLGLAQPPPRPVRQSQEGQTELTWIYGNPLGGEKIFFILQNECVALGLGWGKMLFLLLFSLSSWAAHGRRKHLGH